MERDHNTHLALQPLTQTGRVRLVEVEMTGRVAEGAQVLREPETAAGVLSELIGNKDREHFVALHLDNGHRIIAAEIVAIGVLNSASVHPREVFKAAILNNAQAIICGHNHPSCSLDPSPDDLSIDKRLCEAGDLLGIRVLDFVIVSGARYWTRTDPYPRELPGAVFLHAFRNRGQGPT